MSSVTLKDPRRAVHCPNKHLQEPRLGGVAAGWLQHPAYWRTEQRLGLPSACQLSLDLSVQIP